MVTSMPPARQAADPSAGKVRGCRWNCPWPLDWQRHYRILADLAADEPHGALPEIQPGVTFEGDDLGRWLQRQANFWVELSEEQQERLSRLGVKPAEMPPPAPAATRATKARARRSRPSTAA